MKTLRPPFALVLLPELFIAAFTALADDHSSTHAENNSLVEQFKSFIASPPPIERIVFESRMTLVDTNATPIHRSVTNSQAYIARWQPNARAIYQVLPQSISTNPVMNWFSVSVFERKRWQLSPDGMLLLWVDDGMTTPPDAEPNLTKTSVDHLTYRLAQVMNMGVYNLDIGSIRWNGDSFSATNSRVKLGFDATLHAASGRPDRLDVRLTTPTNSLDLRLTYRFDNDTGVRYLPSQIRVAREQNGEMRELSRIDIHSVQFAKAPAPEEAFRPWTNLIAVPVQPRIYTNGAHYAFGADGRLLRTPLTPPLPRYKPQYRGLFLGICAAFSLAIFVLMVRTRANQNRLPPEPRKETV